MKLLNSYLKEIQVDESKTGTLVGLAAGVLTVAAIAGGNYYLMKRDCKKRSKDNSEYVQCMKAKACQKYQRDEKSYKYCMDKIKF